MRILILEDERKAAAELQKLLLHIDDTHEVVAVCKKIWYGQLQVSIDTHVN